MNKDNDKVIFLNSPLREMIWGGNYFKDVLNLAKDDKDYGEYWTISGYSSFPSIIKNGKYQGVSLDKLYKEHHELFANSNSDEFPILVKMIATSADLSVQVHPDDEYAKKDNDLGKTESWLIINSNNGKIVYGHNQKDKESLEKMARSGDFSFLKYHNVKRGNFVPVPAGTIHALGKGLVLLEVQQSSNLTYRLYDYNRKDKNGNLRELHLDKSLDVIKVPNDLTIDDTDYLDSRDDVELWNNEYFNIKLVNVPRKIRFMNKEHKYYLCTVASGLFRYEDMIISVGESFIVTSLAETEEIVGKGKLLIVESYR
ncbi:MAG: mannose-6-phosphate isomerase [Bacilli bacterium]|nr:mannose-6-phosphate isomerase [Bacilli bacterium]